VLAGGEEARRVVRVYGEVEKDAAAGVGAHALPGEVGLGGALQAAVDYEGEEVPSGQPRRC
jgi:hypothetical protein